MNNKILILGASGFIGNTIYKDLLPYFDVYGTYATPTPELENNHIMFSFNAEKDTISNILNQVQPNIIISSLRGSFEAQYKVHQEINDYVLAAINCKIIYLSTVNVFDANGEFPSYENDDLLAESDYGKLKISVEKIIRNLPKSKYAIIRLPMVLGVNSPRIIQLKEASKNHTEFEVYPNLIISVITADKIAQQLHYIINKNLEGIFHLASNDVMHHFDIIEEISNKLGLKNVIYKQIFTSNKDRYLAILPKYNKLPKNYQITISEVIEDCTLKEEIDSLK
ncbi:MAG: sugar nucleotide-binding protein [Flavobacteriaceae bacterium]|nr:sugar nucleotide-binding protein [Flavobacteriaceae bacterium]